MGYNGVGNVLFVNTKKGIILTDTDAGSHISEEPSEPEIPNSGKEEHEKA